MTSPDCAILGVADLDSFNSVIGHATVGQMKDRCSSHPSILPPSIESSSSHTMIIIYLTCLDKSLNHTNLVVSLPQADGLWLGLSHPQFTHMPLLLSHQVRDEMMPPLVIKFHDPSNNLICARTPLPSFLVSTSQIHTPNPYTGSLNSYKIAFLLSSSPAPNHASVRKFADTSDCGLTALSCRVVEEEIEGALAVFGSTIHLRSDPVVFLRETVTLKFGL